MNVLNLLNKEGEMAGDKVRCAVCKHQAKSFCLVKKCKVALNKRRKCNKFHIDPSRVKLKQELPTRREPHPSVLKDMRKEYKKAMKLEAARQEAAKYAEEHKYADALRMTNDKHPLTGDLSRFTTTARKD